MFSQRILRSIRVVINTILMHQRPDRIGRACVCLLLCDVSAADIERRICIERQIAVIHQAVCGSPEGERLQL